MRRREAGRSPTRSSSSTTASRGAATRSSTCATCPRRARPTSGRRSARRVEAMAFEHPDVAPAGLPRPARAGRRDRRGARRRRRAAQPERAAAGDAARRGRAAVHARSAAGRPERPDATWAAGSPPTSATRARSRARRRRSASGWRSEGVLGRFAVDFVVVRDRDGDMERRTRSSSTCARAGTTHPFLTLQFLTDGTYDPGTALFTAPSGREKHLVATDHLEDELLRGLTIDDLFDIAVRHRLHFDQARQTGVVFHMMGALAELGQRRPDRRRRQPRAGGCDVPPRRARAPRGGGPGARAAAAGALTARADDRERDDRQDPAGRRRDPASRRAPAACCSSASGSRR